MTTDEIKEAIFKELDKYRQLAIKAVEDTYEELRKQEEEFKNDSTRASDVSGKIGE